MFSFITGTFFCLPFVGVWAQSLDQNYIVTTVPIVPVADPTTLTDVNSISTIQYFDGLGRTIQTVQKAISGITGADLVTLTEYDSTGREYKHWLPITNAGNGAFLSPATITGNTTSLYGGDTKPYAITEFEPSPLNRITRQYGPGAAWNSHPTGIVYGTNTASSVAYFFVNGNNQLQRTGSYNANTLYKTVFADEDGKTTTEYKDKQGQVVMKRSDADVDTYFVYNNLGQLCYVLPPNAVDLLTFSGTFNDNATAALTKFAYLYQYDSRGNCKMKRLPGCAPIYMVYDKADHMVLSQDGNQRVLVNGKNEWTVTKYDVFGRVIFTGTTTGLDPASSLQVRIDNYKSELIIETYTPGTGYSNLKFSDAKPLTVNYYDTYDFTALQPNGTNLNYINPPTGYDVRYSTAKGLLTGTRTYLLDGTGNNYLTTTLYYDNRGRVVQTQAANLLGGYDRTYNHYNFSGKVLLLRKEHNISGQASIVELYTYSYDNALRPLVTTYSLNGGTPITLTNNTGGYDELGRLVIKKRHNNTDTEAFEYNLRNWTTKITSGTFIEELYYNTNPINSKLCYNGNISLSSWTYNGVVNKYGYSYDNLNRLKSSLLYSSNNASSGAYYESFTYDKQGNIVTTWRNGSSTSPIDALTTTYDGNQLKSVTDQFGSKNMASVKEYQNKSNTTYEFEYDQNGNMIKDLDRDIVTIKYNLLNLPVVIQFRNGNQIKNLYDAGGQKLKSDYYTLLTALSIPLSGGQVLEPIYTASTYNYSGTAYVGNVEYKISKYIPNGSAIYVDKYTVSRLQNAEGYVTSPGGYAQFYSYFRKDHLGNVREVWQAPFMLGSTSVPARTSQITQYYPSGLPWASNTIDNPSTQPYKYNGKEFVEMHGYDTYDYGARGYYPAIMRLTSVDRAAELCYKISPYAYCFNNPNRYIDEDGNIPICQIVKGELGSGYGTRTLDGKTSMHWGLDIKTYRKTGFEIRAAAGGLVVAVEYQENGGGYFIKIDHGNGYTSLYMHLLNKGIVNVGDKVVNGDVIGFSGNSGHSTGPHLHLEFRNSSNKNKDNRKGTFNPQSIYDLQEFIDNGYSNEIKTNEDNPIELDEIIVTPKNHNPTKTHEQRIDDMYWFSVRPNENGNTGRYNKQGRATDPFYSDDFLKWYYNK